VGRAEVIIEKATITAYSSVESCTTKLCIMASGRSAYIGAIACPREIELGTRVKIADTTYVCEDRTARRFNGRFDIFAGYGPKAHRRALVWGIAKLDVEILPKK
jgi:3D (Asp-Asp-Asp) domain-containing protein